LLSLVNTQGRKSCAAKPAADDAASSQTDQP
jgi:hypothetical protein